MELSQKLYEPISRDDANGEDLGQPSVGYWQDVWQRLKKNKLAIAGLIMIVLLALMALVGPHISGYSYEEQDLLMINQAPSSQHWFGTDSLGRDLFTRVWFGARISLMIGILTSVICLVIGVIYGGISGYAGGLVDNVMMRIVEVLYSIPFLLYVILLSVLFEPGLTSILMALGAVYWLNVARIVRGQVLALKEQEYIMAARLMGAGTWRILYKHLIPNSMGPIIVTMTLLIPEAIFTEAFLSFLGLGVSAPMASWGVLANDGLQGLRSYPWQLIFPSIFISLTILAFNFVGDGLRDALDPRMRR